jgi:hypothetical protein
MLLISGRWQATGFFSPVRTLKTYNRRAVPSSIFQDSNNLLKSDAMKSVAPSAPTVILVRTFLDQNVGATARAMLNFGIGELRLVDPQCDWLSDASRVCFPSLLIIEQHFSKRSSVRRPFVSVGSLKRRRMCIGRRESFRDGRRSDGGPVCDICDDGAPEGLDGAPSNPARNGAQDQPYGDC